MGEPLTDADLVEMEAHARLTDDGDVAADVTRLVAEVRRLRSDEWLARGLNEAAGPTFQPAAVGAIMAILRKHRDGTA